MARAAGVEGRGVRGGGGGRGVVDMAWPSQRQGPAPPVASVASLVEEGWHASPPAVDACRRRHRHGRHWEPLGQAMAWPRAPTAIGAATGSTRCCGGSGQCVGGGACAAEGSGRRGGRGQALPTAWAATACGVGRFFVGNRFACGAARGGRVLPPPPPRPPQRAVGAGGEFAESTNGYRCSHRHQPVLRWRRRVCWKEPCATAGGVGGAADVALAFNGKSLRRPLRRLQLWRRPFHTLRLTRHPPLAV